MAQLGLSIALLLVSGWVALEASDYSYMTPIGPGPGFFPLWLSGALAVLAVIHFAATVRARRDSAESPLRWPDWSNALSFRPFWVLVAISLACLLLETVGFCLSMLALNLIIVTLMGRLDRLGLAFAVVGSFGTYHVFSQWLDVSLPKGWLGW